MLYYTLLYADDDERVVIAIPHIPPALEVLEEVLSKNSTITGMLIF